MSADDETGAAGTGAPPDTGGADSTASDAHDERPQTFTADEVQRLVREAETQAWANARRKYQDETRAKQQPPVQAQPGNTGAQRSTETPDDLRARVAQLEEQIAWDRSKRSIRLHREGVSADQSALAEELLDKLRPDDPAKWIEDFYRRAGAVTTNQQGAPQSTERNGPPRSNGGAPGAQRDPSKITDPRTLTEADRRRILEEHGWVKGNRIIRDMVVKYRDVNRGT